MKTAIITACMLLGLSVNAQDDKTPTQANKTSTYCFEAKGEILILTRDGLPVNNDIKLENGTRITANGRIIKPDGTEKLLKEGECTDINGDLMKPAKK